jgi:hypothetical protein
MRARLRCTAALALGVLACRPAAGPADGADVTPGAEPTARTQSLEPPGPSWAPLPSTIQWPAGALAIALPPGEPAPWLLPPFEPGHDHPLDRLVVVAYGERIALARSSELLLATDREQGLVGSIALPPEIGWVGVGGSDRIFAADADGRLFAAAGLAEALGSGLQPTGAVVERATVWDAAGEHVLAVADATLFVSDDGGRSFRSTKPARSMEVATAVVRADGVIVALSEEGRPTAYLSADGGRHWRRSAWHPQSLWREGAWIMGWARDASDGDVTGVLASDGRSWAGGLDRSVALTGYRSWDSDFFGSFGAIEPAVGSWPTLTDPPAPPPPARPLRGQPRDFGGAESEAFGMGGFGTGFSGGACTAGIVCLHGSVGDAPPPSRLDVRVFGDARCEDSGAAPCPLTRQRAPHVGMFDHVARRLSLGRLPRACTKLEVAQARGVGLVRCEHEGTVSLVVVEPDGTAHLELEVSDAKPDPSYVMMAEDGTVLVPEIPTCEQWARAWVRRPVAPGHPDAWTLLELPGARAWRPVGRGYAVAVADHPGSDEGSRADLWLAGPGREPTLLVEAIPVLEGVTGVRVDDGRVSLHADRWLVVRRDASLAEVELPSRDRVVDGVTVTRARPWLGCGEPSPSP